MQGSTGAVCAAMLAAMLVPTLVRAATHVRAQRRRRMSALPFRERLADRVRDAGERRAQGGTAPPRERERAAGAGLRERAHGELSAAVLDGERDGRQQRHAAAGA